MDAPSPEREPEILPRPRGIRAGKSAVRKRKAYHAYQLALQPYRYSSIEEVPVVHQDGSSRPLYTGPGWKPDFDNEEQLEEVIVEVEVDPLIPKSSGLAPCFHRLQRQPAPPPAPPIRPSSASSASSPLPSPPSSTPKAAKVSSGAAPSTSTVAKASSGAAPSTPRLLKLHLLQHQ